MDKHAEARDKKIAKRKSGMRVHGKSIFVIANTIKHKTKLAISGSNKEK